MRKPAATVSSGVSSWKRTKRAHRMILRSASTSAAGISRFAPDATTMEFCPAGSTQISATPVGAAFVAQTAATSTPAAARLAFR